MMERPIGFFPWLLDWRDVLWMVLGGAILIIGIYLATRGGRDRPGATDHPGKRPVRHYAGGVIGTDANPMTVFVILFTVLALLWAGWYVLHTGARGLYY